MSENNSPVHAEKRGYGVLRQVLFAGLVVMLLGFGTLWLALHSEVFWRWAGFRIISAVNDRLNGELKVEAIEGTPFRGYALHGIRLDTPEGEVFRAKGLMLRLSLWSIVRLAPVVDKLILFEPQLTLVQGEDGGWQVSRLWPAREGPVTGLPIPVKSLIFSCIRIENGQVRVSQLGSDRRFENLDLDLSLRVINPLTPEPRFEVSSSHLAADTPWGRFSLEAELTYSNQGIDLPFLLLSSEDQRLLSLAGDISLMGRKPFNLAGEIGPLPPALLARFYEAWPSSWRPGGTIKIDGQPSDFRVALKGEMAEATVNLEGQVKFRDETPAYDVKISLMHLSPVLLAALDLPGREIYGRMSPVSLHLDLKGRGLAWPPPEFSWRLQAEPFTLGSARVETVAVQAAGDPARQELIGEVAGNFGSLNLAGSGSFLTALQGEIKLRLRDFQPGLLGLPEAAETSLSASFDGAFRAPELARMADLHLGGRVEASGRLRGLPLKYFLGRFAWERPRLTLDEVRIQLGNVAAELRGTLDGDRLDFTHQGRTLAGGDWPVPGALKGSASWSGVIRGTAAEPDFSLKAQGRDLTLAALGLRSVTLRAEAVGLPPHHGVLELKAEGVKTPAGAFQELKLRANGTGQRWCLRLWAGSEQPEPRVALFGNIDLAGRPLALVVSHLELALRGIRVKNQGAVQARLLPGLELPTAAFTVNGGSVQVAARWQADEVAANLEIREIPLELAGVPGLRGRLNSRLELSGSPRVPVLAGTVNLTPFSYKKYAVKTINTTFSYREGVLRLAGQAEESPGGVRFSWEGSLPQQLSLSPYRLAASEAELDFSFRTEGGNLRLLEKFVPEVAKADAPLDLQVRIKGNWRQPEVSADLRWQQGFITLHQAGIPYHLAPGVLSWQGNKLSLPQLTLESGGTGRLTGEADFQGYQPRTVRLRAVVDNFKLLDRLGSEAWLNGEANLTGPFEALVLRGQFFIPRGTINPALIRPLTRPHPDIVRVRDRQPKPAEPQDSPRQELGFYRNLTIDLGLEAPNNLWVRQKTPQVAANVELTGAIRARKRPGESLTLAGQVSSLEGKLTIFKKDFNVDKAVVTLPGQAAQQPSIEARLSHEMADATLLVDVSGSVARPQIDLSSSPPLTPNDLMSYLLFNRPAGALSQEEFDAGQQAVGVLGGITASKIQELLGEDFPILGDVTLRGTTGGLGLTKPLAKGVTITLERRTGPTAKEDPSTVRLEYRINRFLRLQAEQGQRNTGGDILFRYDF